MGQISTVITGDLVDSRNAGESINNASMTALSAGARAIETSWGFDCRFTRFRGDGWQIHLPDPAATLDAVILLLAHLRASGTTMETRAAIAIAPVDSLGSADLADAAGAAFTIAGDLLAGMSRTTRIAIGGRITPWHPALIDLLDFQISKWTAFQAEAVALSLTKGTGGSAPDQYPRHQAIANHLKISRQAVQMRLSAAGEPALSQALDVMRRHDYAAEHPT